MDDLPIDVLCHLASTFLGDRDRLALAQTHRSAWTAARRDTFPHPIVLDAVLDVRGQDGFRKSPHGYWYCLPVVADWGVPTVPHHLGALASAKPWAFVRQWLCLSENLKTTTFRRQCVQSLSVQDTWHADVLVALKILLTTSRQRWGQNLHSQLLRRAVWYGRTDVVTYLMDQVAPTDHESTALLQLALGTLGYENTESQGAELVHELLKRGANPLVHNLWAIRMTLQLNFLVVASLMCVYALKWYDGQTLLSLFVHELLDCDRTEHAALVKSSMKIFMFLP